MEIYFDISQVSLQFVWLWTSRLQGFPLGVLSYWVLGTAFWLEWQSFVENRLFYIKSNFEFWKSICMVFIFHVKQKILNSCFGFEIQWFHCRVLLAERFCSAFEECSLYISGHTPTYFDNYLPVCSLVRRQTETFEPLLFFFFFWCTIRINLPWLMTPDFTPGHK